MGTQTNIADYHYLIVDDDEITRMLVVRMLQKMGATKIDIAENGEIALDHLNADTMPDIIISDLYMPQLDGVEFIRHLAEKQFAGGIVLMSSSGKRFLRIVSNFAEQHKLNVLGTMPKPFTIPALQDFLLRFNGVKEKPSLPPPPQLVTEEALRKAIEQNQLVPFFQPKVAVKTGIVVGVEALARWQHPERGLIPPNLFIPVAEKHDLIDLLTEDILFKTLQQISIWHKSGLLLTFAINFSALSLSDMDLPNRIEAELNKYNIDPSYLTLEITESRLLDNITSSMETLLRLHLKGIHLSIDDFGTGHSSLEELHRLPFTELKIDRVFVNGATHDEEALLFMQSSVSLAKKLGLSIVAEGVETQKEWDICAQLDCDIIQGFFIARPMSAAAFLDWHRHRETLLKQIKPHQPCTKIPPTQLHLNDKL